MKKKSKYEKKTMCTRSDMRKARNKQFIQILFIYHTLSISKKKDKKQNKQQIFPKGANT